ncbi:hypothetical protein CCACVL1_10920 [Corchorus capsularis]|uniref:Uncharacterized protein n=1 Tax=Corchorus capsularis TaxID=210143 RepID=A0A1R3INW4_COCAP|nr:hypothetical protein CCACVL1_10920 [Corchorus capsularis]
MGSDSSEDSEDEDDNFDEVIFFSPFKFQYKTKLSHLSSETPPPRRHPPLPPLAAVIDTTPATLR